MPPAIAFTFMIAPFLAVIALLLWNLKATRRAMSEGEPATWMRPVRPANAEPPIEQAPVVAPALSGEDEASVAALRAEIERKREELDRQSAEIAEMEARLTRPD